jgi:hypothetical protein
MRTIEEQRASILEMANPDRKNFSGIVTVFDDALKILAWAERATFYLKDYRWELSPPESEHEKSSLEGINKLLYEIGHRHEGK